MNKILLLFSVFACILLLSNKGGINKASTSASFEMNNGCGDCHSGGNFDSSGISIQLRDVSNTVVSKYESGKEYTVEVTVTGKNATYYGFQAVATDKTNAQAGTIGTLGTSVRRSTFGGRVYTIQSAPRADGKFNFKWTAPNIDSVKWNIAGIAANGNNGSNGDRGVRNQVSMYKGITSSVIESDIQTTYLRTNVISDQIIFNQEVSNAEVYNINGQRQKLNKDLDVHNLTNGMYIVKFVVNNKTKSEKIYVSH